MPTELTRHLESIEYIGDDEDWENDPDLLNDPDEIEEPKKSSSNFLENFLNIDKQAPPGPPPRPGLQWKPSTRRWIRPEFGELEDKKKLHERYIGELEDHLKELEEFFDNDQISEEEYDREKSNKERILGDQRRLRAEIEDVMRESKESERDFDHLYLAENTLNSLSRNLDKLNRRQLLVSEKQVIEDISNVSREIDNYNQSLHFFVTDLSMIKDLDSEEDADYIRQKIDSFKEESLEALEELRQLHVFSSNFEKIHALITTKLGSVDTFSDEELDSIFDSNSRDKELQTLDDKILSQIGFTSSHVELWELEDGTRVIYKPETGEDRTLRNDIFNPQWLNEVAAYKLAEELGLAHLIPRVTYRKTLGEIGSIQEFIPGAITVVGRGGFIPEPQWDKAGQDAAFFDILIGNEDRHAGNAIADKKSNLLLIDHGLAFPRNEQPENFSSIFVSAYHSTKISDEHKKLADELVNGEMGEKLRVKMKAWFDDDKVVSGIFWRAKRLLNANRYGEAIRW